MYEEIYKLLIPKSVAIKTLCRDVCNLPIGYTNTHTHTGRRQNEFFNSLGKINNCISFTEPFIMVCQSLYFF